ncbi:MAG: hypothetical protein KDE56_12420 [Anaerolineales bacterium]|nr:hypothetical protein [Anaerolineales bacterium]
MRKNLETFIQNLRKAIELWSSRLTQTGKIILWAAIVGFVWFLLQMLNAIFGHVVPRFSDIGLGWLAFVLNLVAFFLVFMVVVQIAYTYYSYQEAQQNYREMIVRGRKGGNRMEQMAGRRNRASGQRRGASAANMRMTPDLTADQVNRNYPMRWFKKPTLVEDWKEISEAGVYALSSEPKKKIEILDASEIGGGFYLGTWSGRFVPTRDIVVNKAGRPVNFATLRLAKKGIPRNLSGSAKEE